MMNAEMALPARDQETVGSDAESLTGSLSEALVEIRNMINARSERSKLRAIETSEAIREMRSQLEEKGEVLLLSGSWEREVGTLRSGVNAYLKSRRASKDRNLYRELTADGSTLREVVGKIFKRTTGDENSLSIEHRALVLSKSGFGIAVLSNPVPAPSEGLAMKREEILRFEYEITSKEMLQALRSPASLEKLYILGRDALTEEKEVPAREHGHDQDILELVRNGRKIEAIKLCRTRYDLGLHEAKDHIDKLVVFEQESRLAEFTETAEKLAANPETIPEDFNGFITALNEGQKIQAVKFYRDLTGIGLKEAKDVVEALMEAMKHTAT